MDSADQAVIKTWFDELFSWKSACVLGTFAFGLSYLRGWARVTFGLSDLEMFRELVMALTVFGTLSIFVVLLCVAIAHFLDWCTRKVILLVAVPVLLLASFLFYAHLAMSQALMPLKREFDARAVVVTGGETDYGSALDATLIKRDRLLAEYGYLHLGGWHADEGRADCSSVYLFVGTF